MKRNVPLLLLLSLSAGGCGKHAARASSDEQLAAECKASGHIDAECRRASAAVTSKRARDEEATFRNMAGAR